MIQEIWLPIPIKELGGHYEASNVGNIRSLDRVVETFNIRKNRKGIRTRKGRVLSPGKARYLQVHLSVDNVQSTHYVHRLVAKTHIFNDDPVNKTEVDHINGDRYDNRVENLKWVTPSQNMTAAYDNNQQHHGTKNHHAKLTEEQVFEILELRRTTDLTCEKIGEMFGVSGGIVSLIARGKRWKRLTNI